MFWLFPVATACLSMLAFLLFALPLTWLSHADPVWARRYKIQSRHDRHVGTAEALQVWLVNNLYAFAVAVLMWPLLRLSEVHAGPLPPW